MKELFFELGLEELPARLVKRAQAALAQSLSASLKEAALEHGPITTYATPRRLALSVQVQSAQADVTQELLGPPARVAFDDQGAPTRAALAFAQRHGIDAGALTTKETPRGAYLAATVFTQGAKTRDLASDMLLSAVAATRWPKVMHWSDGQGPFIRPVRWIVALFGGEQVGLELFGIQASNQSRGHRFMAPDEFSVTGADDWCRQLRHAFVEPDPARRSARIEEEATALAASIGGELVMGDYLLEELTYLSEWPVALLGEFDASFLQIPSAVLITSMKVHQKYAAIQKPDGELSNHFILVAGLPSSAPATVVLGNQRVLAARLADARFFFDSDKKKSLDAFVQALENRVYLKGLGTVADKAARLGDLSGRYAEALGLPETQVALATRAGFLAKADLSSAMVGEFAGLQGTMGRRYAALAGEDPAVAKAIEEHYSPKHATAELPGDLISASVALADRFDALIGCFSLGLEPTGSADPYALRRGALGIIRILTQEDQAAQGLGLPRAIDLALDAYGDVIEGDRSNLRERLLGFFRGRLKHSYAKVFPTDLTEAVVSSGFDRPADVFGRLQALAKVKAAAGWDDLAIAVKRVVRIVADQAPEALKPQTLQGEAERALYEATSSQRAGIQTALKAGRYDEAIAGLIALKPPIDRFFDEVMVMSEDPGERQRRLALLGEIADLFGAMASFDKVST